jgi:protein phosphatase 1G
VFLEVVSIGALPAGVHQYIMGAYLDVPITEKHTTEGGNEYVRHGASEMQGWRKNMEDAHITVPTLAKDGQNNVAFYAVFDGHGGEQVAKFAERHMPNIMLNNEAFRRGDYQRALSRAFLQIDEMLEQPMYQREIGMEPVTTALQKRSEESQEVKQKEDEARKMMQEMMVMRRTLQGGTVSAGGGAEGNRKTCALDEHPVRCGCTAVAALIVGNKVVCANAGDSRCVLSRKGMAVPLSYDHKPNDQGETDRIVAAGGFITAANGHFRVNGNLNLSRSLGDLKYKQNKALPQERQMITASPDFVTETLQMGDEFIIMACDGVWDVLSNQDAVDFVRTRLQKGMPLGKISEEVFDRCIAVDPKETRGIGGDNMTCIVIKLAGKF